MMPISRFDRVIQNSAVWVILVMGLAAASPLIAGDEYITFAEDGSGKKNVTLMVQLPAVFDPDTPCIVTAPSSRSMCI